MEFDVDWLEARARISPLKTAVMDGETGQTWTYQDLYKHSMKVAQHLINRGIKSGDRVTLLAPNDISYFYLIFACRRIGAIFVPLNIRFSIKELQGIIQDCRPAYLAYHADQEDLATQLNVKMTEHSDTLDRLTDLELTDGHLKEIFSWEHPWMMIYTGGTTGKPKGVVLTNRSIHTNALNTVISWGLHETDCTLTVLPMFHTGGINALTLPILYAGGKVVYAKNFHKQKVIKLLLEEHCTIVLMVPTMYHELLQSNAFQEAEFPRIKTFLSGGAPCPTGIYEGFRKKSLPFREGYGMTEAGPNNFFISPDDAKKKPGSVGKPMFYNEVRVVDANRKEVETNQVGELAIRGGHVFHHYWGNQEKTNEVKDDGWFYTGDLAKKDQVGDHYILGRTKDMVISGGENVYPQEVEEVLEQHPGILEVSVIGIPDEKWGEIVVSVIVLRSGSTLNEEVLRNFCANKLADYKIPKRVQWRGYLPKTDIGKIDKKTLIDEFRNGKSMS